MKLFQNFMAKRKKSKEEAEREQRMVFEAGSYANTDVRKAFLQGNCEMITESSRQNLEIKKEYEVVTSYLSDIQKIDMMSDTEKRAVVECAQKVINLTEERRKMQKVPAKITMAQRNALDPYQDTMPEEIRRMEENENYLQLVNSDLRQLESERAALDYEMEDIVHHSTLLRRMMIYVFGFICVFICVLFVIQESMGKDVQVSFMLTVAFGMLAAMYFFFYNRKSTHDLRVAEKKRNRAVFLTNKVKIKYVNCTNLLEYCYEKFHVSNSKELQYHWQEYIRLQEEEKRFAKAEDLIDFYSKELVKELRRRGIQDADIWVYQPEALVDSKEMVEVRHRLNIRRQKLRQQIDYNNGQAESAKQNLVQFMEKHPEYEKETMAALKECGAEIRA